MYLSSVSSLDVLLLFGLNLLAEIGFAALLMAVALSVLMMRGHARLTLRWGAAIVTALGVTVALKHLLAGDSILKHFPSGHVTLAVAFYGGLGLLLFPGRPVSRPLSALIVLFILGAVAVVEGVARMASTEHTLLDVVGGFFVGLSALVLTGNPWTWNAISVPDRLWLLGAMIAALPFCWLAYRAFDPWQRGVMGV